ncbi:alpha-1,4-glucan--maltose-1-phosphate maltosyltransferase [Chondromyces crocatus]|uniref:Alpha-1,4-glucan:maltose-1-phosphate maltosyltransferase n=1 Tax=Chondromyces crocatus TaxID=52 RepID=A0A0K1E8Q1_CHOCO|nr:alpha-1,4-glucan--maltose-1-phosphate maltosyltransferase [Chondromyces crocatus]AKT37256.1 alpha-1,4-glucan:maltose-1-phosphate maltosyltransferase [Chondromyces crocatus]
MHGRERNAGHPWEHMVERGHLRVLVERVRPELDGGRFPVKRVIGDPLEVEVDLIPDGHDAVGGALLVRAPAPASSPPGGAPDAEARPWQEVPLARVDANDRFRATVTLTALGIWEYTVVGWIEPFTTWQRGTRRKVEAGQDVAVELLEGAALLAAAAKRAADADAQALATAAATLGSTAAPLETRLAVGLAAETAALAARAPDRARASTYPRVLQVIVDPPRARFSAWYEFFPRSFGDAGQHGTFASAERMLPYVAGMGFDVVYLPPIHPIGRAHRKGRNNTLTAEADDPGSPWAIGAAEGGHTAVHPALGTLADFDHFVGTAREHGLEIALDIAFQASPDHPWVKEHPAWFKARPDGTIQYAENPPKKYQDVYPFDFESSDWQAMWEALRDVFLFWADHGVKIFRVDNPHTKALPFWEYCLREVKAAHPDAIFLAEAFTRPTLMHALAKLGFTQSYTYFTWRTTKDELTEYLTRLTRTEVAEFYRPNFWPNTPDILPEHLQTGSRPVFIARLVLAATLSSNYGMYGPAFELMDHVPRPGSEEYIDNEKYELKRWELDRPGSLRHVIQRVNEIRRENRALQQTNRIHFHETGNDAVFCFSKTSDDGESLIVVVVNLDPDHTQSAWLELDLPGITDQERSFQVHDLLSNARYQWKGRRAFVELDPRVMPAHIFRVRRFVRSEQNFEYYL